MPGITIVRLAIVAAPSAGATLVDVLQVSLLGDDVVALPDAGAAVLALAEALDALAACVFAGALVEGCEVAGFHGDGDLKGDCGRGGVFGGDGVGEGGGEDSGEDGEEEGGTHFGWLVGG